MPPVLKRRVWIVERDADAPDTTRARREVDRVGRLHWLAGHRDAGECWDAYEAPEGAPLDTRPSSAPWSRARLWLSDLAAELAASARDATTPVLALDRVWVRPDGRAVLLDWPAPGATGSPADLAAVPLLESIGRLAMGYEHATPVPVSAVTMLDRWRKRPQLGLDELQSDLVAVSLSPAEVSRTRRLLPLAANATLTVFGVIAAVITLFLTKKAGDPSLPATLVFVCASVSFGGAVMSVLVRPSGLVMSALGLAVLTRDGREIGRIRAVWRLLVAWSPVACYAALCTPMSLRSFVMTPVPAFGVIALLLAGVIWTALRPTRGPHDRICGTQIGVR